MRSRKVTVVGVVFAILGLGILACVGDDPTGAATVEAGGGGVDGGGSEANPNPTDDGSLPCPSPKTTCDGKCVDTSADPTNCGACGTTCTSTKCFEGICGGDKTTAVATGENFACALRASGSVWCWGGNSVAQLGARTVADEQLCEGTKCQPLPVRIAGVEKVASIAAGFGAACAVTQTGDAYCWGRNARGELGDVPVEVCAGGPCVTKPTKLPFGEPIAEISLGIGSSCVRTLSQDVYCFGDNNYGIRGNGDVDAGAITVPVKVALPPGASSISLGAGPKTHACARVGTSAHCWGANTNQQIRALAAGACMSGPCEPTPVVIPGLGTVAQVIAGDGHTCVRAGGQVRCWGYDGYGIGEATAGPITIAGLAGAVEIAGKDRHVCGRLPDGTVRCFGASPDARLGFVADFVPPHDCTTGPCKKTPQIVPGLTALSMSTFNQSVAVRFDGAVVAWGSNRSGLLGHLAATNGDISCPTASGAVPCNPTPQPIPMLP